MTQQYGWIDKLHERMDKLEGDAQGGEEKRRGEDDERFGRMLSGAMAEQHERNFQESKKQDEQRHAELLEHLKAIGDSHKALIDSHQGLIQSLNAHTEALKAHTESRDGEVEVTKTGTVNTPQGEHRMNVTEIHRRKR